MKKLARKVVRCYPAAWRDRYAGEMEALLEQMNLRASDILDLLFGATQAHISRLKEQTLMNRVSRTPMIAVLLGLFLIALALLPGGKISENAGEFLLVVAIVTVLPTIGALAVFYPAETAQANRITRRIGQLSGAALAVSVLISAAVAIFTNGQVVPISALTLLFMAGIAGLSLWFVLNGWLSLRGGRLPTGLAVLGMLTGPLLLAVFIVAGGLLPASVPSARLMGAMNIITPLWLLTFVVWLVWTAAWLWLRRQTPTRDHSKTSEVF